MEVLSIHKTKGMSEAQVAWLLTITQAIQHIGKPDRHDRRRHHNHIAASQATAKATAQWSMSGTYNRTLGHQSQTQAASAPTLAHSSANLNTTPAIPLPTVSNDSNTQSNRPNGSKCQQNTTPAPQSQAQSRSKIKQTPLPAPCPSPNLPSPRSPPRKTQSHARCP
jgi:hypothetical protein